MSQYIVTIKKDLRVNADDLRDLVKGLLAQGHQLDVARITEASLRYFTTNPPTPISSEAELGEFLMYRQNL